jgi:hypothetical protein
VNGSGKHSSLFFYNNNKLGKKFHSTAGGLYYKTF